MNLDLAMSGCPSALVGSRQKTPSDRPHSDEGIDLSGDE
jgi:hypothetical protein